MIRYIGQTTQPLPKRREQHIENPTNPAMGVWIGILVGQGLEPVIRQVARVPRGNLDRAEKEQIELHGRKGHPLLNKEFKSQHLKTLLRDARNRADGSTAVAAPEEPRKPPADKTGPMSLTPESVRWLRRRAERHIRLPAGRNRFEVFLFDVAWLLCAWLLLITLFCFRATRMILGHRKAVRRAVFLVPMVLCTRMDPGLRAFTHDYVTSHLPIARIEGMWHKYFEHFTVLEVKGVGVTMAILAGLYFLVLTGTYGEQIEAARTARARKAKAKPKPRAAAAAFSPSGHNSFTAQVGRDLDAQVARDLDAAVLHGVPASPAVAFSLSQPPAPS